MSEYPNNSVKYRSSLDKADTKTKKPKKRPKAVVTGNVTKVKKSFSQRLLDSIVKEDLPDIKTRLIEEVIIPNLQEGTFNLLNNALAIIFGRPVKSSGGRTNYSSASTRASYTPYYNDRTTSETRRPTYQFDDVLFDTRQKADSVIHEMYGTIDEYGIVSVADYYDLSGLVPTSNDFNYGWTSLDGATVSTVRDGYIIKLPRAKSIK